MCDVTNFKVMCMNLFCVLHYRSSVFLYDKKKLCASMFQSYMKSNPRKNKKDLQLTCPKYLMLIIVPMHAHICHIEEHFISPICFMCI